MADDLTVTQAQGGDEWRRAQEVSLKHRTPPTQVPGYDIERCLGEGAYGEVWVAVDRNNPGRRVAIKFYTRRSGDWTLLAREVEKLNFRATDRYVVQLLDVGWNADPPYYVMEFMEKGSLAERLQEGTLSVPTALALFRDVALGVVSAHNRGVLHCDLKPANVLLGLDDKPRLADFGQSRLSNEQTPALGTLFYMAPEQADLKANPDARWDVYALGALLHCLLTGEPPYRDVQGVTTLDEASALDDRLARYRRLLQESHRPRKHRRVPGMDRALADIIDRCLAVSPAKRYPNVQAVLNALDTRALRRAAVPLLVMGAVGPVLLLILMGLLIRTELQTAVRTATDTLTEETKVSNRFAAQAVAEKVAGRIDRRWRTLEQEAADPDFQRLLKAARGKKLGTPEQQALQATLDERFKDHSDMKAEGWAVFDDEGTFLARSPWNQSMAKFVGKQFAFKNFFTGRETDGKETDRFPPLTHVFRSNVFLSTLSGTRQVAFSVPVWQRQPPGPDQLQEQPRVGVLMMTVEVGTFAELQPQGTDEDSKSFVAVLVDKRGGVILEHPLLAELRKKNRSELDPAKKKELEQSLEFVVKDLDWFKPGGWNPNYEDPVGEKHKDYDAKWLAASYPVRVEDRPKNVRDTGWWVIVQEQYDSAIGPVVRLENDMIVRGRWAVAIAVIVVTGLWLFVIVVLNESAGSRLFALLRRRAGLASESPSASMKGSSIRTQAVKRPLQAPGAPTVTDRPK